MSQDDMFHECEDSNGVKSSWNSHPASEFGHPPSEQRPAFPHWMAGNDGEGGYEEAAAENLVHKAKDRVLRQVGTGRGGMTFNGDLLPRSERVDDPGRPMEEHGPGCCCDKCRPTNVGMANLSVPSTAWRKR